MEKAVILSEKGMISSFGFTPFMEIEGTGSAPASLNLETHEKMVIRQALKEQQGNVSAAAKVLGINRSTLYQKMKKYGI